MSHSLLARKPTSEPASRARTPSRGSSSGLRIGEPDDALENEADRAADDLMSVGHTSPAWSLSRIHIAPTCQRECSCGGSADSGAECDSCQRKKATLQREPSGSTRPKDAPPIVDEVIRDPGTPLDDSTRRDFESAFGRDFGRVRIHTGSTAEQAAREVSAHAFAVDRHIAFGPGRYAPESDSGRRLLAHELAHTVQQGHAPSLPESASQPESARSLRSLSRTPMSVQRSFGDDKPGLKSRSGGLTAEEWAKIKKVRKFFNLPDRPTKSKPTIVGILEGPDGKEYPLKSGEEGGPYGGTQRGGIPRGEGEAFTQGGQHQGNIASHVEGHAAAVMHEHNFSEATLLIEEPPCQGACDQTRGWDAEKGDWPEGSARSPRRAAPAIDSALPPGAKLTVVDPEATGIYRSTQAAPRTPPPSALPKPGGNPLPRTPPGDSLSGVLSEEGGHLGTSSARSTKAGSFKEGILEEEVLESRALRVGSVGELALSGAANIALDIVLLVTAVIWELVVVPKLNAIMQGLLTDRRKRLREQIQKKFDIHESKHIGRIVKSCYLKTLRAMEKAGKSGYVSVKLRVSFEDTSHRFQILKETPPESLFDLDFYDVDLESVRVVEDPVKTSVGPLTRCKNCGPFGGDKSLVRNLPIWAQTVNFSFKAPRVEELEQERFEEGHEEKPSVGECIAESACFIATACYGSSMAPEVDLLRRFRNQVLLPTRLGTLFARAYYRFSPPVAGWLETRPVARRLVRTVVIHPLVMLVRRCRLEGPEVASESQSNHQHSPTPGSLPEVSKIVIPWSVLPRDQIRKD